MFKYCGPDGCTVYVSDPNAAIWPLYTSDDFYYVLAVSDDGERVAVMDYASRVISVFDEQASWLPVMVSAALPIMTTNTTTFAFFESEHASGAVYIKLLHR